jgi:hypothetical protein
MGLPQAEQNRADAGFSRPQAAQGTAAASSFEGLSRETPHPAQNRADARFSSPQAAHLIAVAPFTRSQDRSTGTRKSLHRQPLTGQLPFPALL